MPYYRFKCGAFIQAENFREAKNKFIAKIELETEEAERWTPCICLGFQHREDCPEKANEQIAF